MVDQEKTYGFFLVQFLFSKLVILMVMFCFGCCLICRDRGGAAQPNGVVFPPNR